MAASLHLTFKLLFIFYQLVLVNKYIHNNHTISVNIPFPDQPTLTQYELLLFCTTEFK